MSYKKACAGLFIYFLLALFAIAVAKNFDWATRDKQQIQVLIDNKVVYQGPRDAVISYIEGDKIRVDVYGGAAQLFVIHTYYGGGNGNVVERTL